MICRKHTEDATVESLCRVANAEMIAWAKSWAQAEGWVTAEDASEQMKALLQQATEQQARALEEAMQKIKSQERRLHEQEQEIENLRSMLSEERAVSKQAYSVSPRRSSSSMHAGMEDTLLAKI